ncbi:hypothetical protein GQ55_5G287100 [Panicum hallii var. hallii]|uniref:Uncharacterized protein n=2 Tax=Panicum hallii TaxID=206008 RepID=A0A2T7DL75_9POAL|nr:hypothetical protein GQ55_5G287100 [Panicum hallii var. hallii]PVH38572.1 hypothetical protein PAHAL_5G291800 [Panicum hallii]
MSFGLKTNGQNYINNNHPAIKYLRLSSSLALSTFFLYRLVPTRALPRRPPQRCVALGSPAILAASAHVARMSAASHKRPCAEHLSFSYAATMAVFSLFDLPHPRHPSWIGHALKGCGHACVIGSSL